MAFRLWAGMDSTLAELGDPLHQNATIEGMEQARRAGDGDQIICPMVGQGIWC